MEKLTDESLMPYGSHKGKKMANVPDEHLRWLYENNRCSNSVREYILENSDVLKISKVTTVTREAAILALTKHANIGGGYFHFNNQELQELLDSFDLKLKIKNNV